MADESTARQDGTLTEDLSVFEVQDTCGCGVPHGPGGHHHAPAADPEDEGPRPSVLHDLARAQGAEFKALNGIVVATHVPDGGDAAALRLVDCSHLQQVALRGRGAEPATVLARATGLALASGGAARLDLPAEDEADGLTMPVADFGAHLLAVTEDESGVARLRNLLAPYVMVKAVRNRALLRVTGEDATRRLAEHGIRLAPGTAQTLTLAGAEVWAMAEHDGASVVLSVPEAAAAALAESLLARGDIAMAGIAQSAPA